MFKLSMLKMLKLLRLKLLYIIYRYIINEKEERRDLSRTFLFLVPSSLAAEQPGRA